MTFLHYLWGNPGFAPDVHSGAAYAPPVAAAAAAGGFLMSADRRRRDYCNWDCDGNTDARHAKSSYRYGSCDDESEGGGLYDDSYASHVAHFGTWEEHNDDDGALPGENEAVEVEEEDVESSPSSTSSPSSLQWNITRLGERIATAVRRRALTLLDTASEAASSVVHRIDKAVALQPAWVSWLLSGCRTPVPQSPLCIEWYAKEQDPRPDNHSRRRSRSLTANDDPLPPCTRSRRIDVGVPRPDARQDETEEPALKRRIAEHVNWTSHHSSRCRPLPLCREPRSPSKGDALDSQSSAAVPKPSQNSTPSKRLRDSDGHATRPT